MGSPPPESGPGAGALEMLSIASSSPSRPRPAQRWSFRISGRTVPSRAVSAWVRAEREGVGPGGEGLGAADGRDEGWAPGAGNAGRGGLEVGTVSKGAWLRRVD